MREEDESNIRWGQADTEDAFTTSAGSAGSTADRDTTTMMRILEVIKGHAIGHHNTPKMWVKSAEYIYDIVAKVESR